MPRKQSELQQQGDAVLAGLARAGDSTAFAELWRRHVAAGTVAARQFSAIADAEDIVSEAYVRILRAVQGGGGPHEAFRPYLYRTIRNIALDWRARHPSVSLEESADLVAPESIEITVLENAVTARAFERLPERWQAVLWFLEVEGMTPAAAAPYLGLSPNATSALAARAHEGFKRTWLQAHVNDRSVPAECRWTTERMGRYVRGSLTRRSRARFDRHVEQCGRCSLLIREIGDLGDQLASVLLPLAVGTASGSLLLSQLREHAVGAVVATALPPAAATSGAGIVSGAAALVLVVSGSVLVANPVETPAPPPSVGGDSSSVRHPSDDGDLPGSSADAVVESETTSSPDAAAIPAAVAPAAPIDQAPSSPDPVAATPPAAPAPLVDLSVSVLGIVDLDAQVGLDPSTGLLVRILPGLPLLGGRH